MQPPANASRALAMSTLGVSTGNAGGPDLRHRRFDQGQQDVDVVDHQVQDHVHVGRPAPEAAQAVGLDEQGLVDALAAAPGRRG